MNNIVHILSNIATIFSINEYFYIIIKNHEFKIYLENISSKAYTLSKFIHYHIIKCSIKFSNERFLNQLITRQI